MSKEYIRNWNERHEQVLTKFLNEPWLKQKDLAAEFGYSRSWTSKIFNSEEFNRRFKARLRARTLMHIRERRISDACIK